MKSRWKRYFVLIVLIGLADAIFKYFAITRLPEGGRLSLPLDLALHKNPGIAFDIPIPMWIIVLLTVIITYFLVKHAQKWQKVYPARSFASVIIIVGALGNMFDRIINGFTTDYIIIFGRSALNLSDFLIIFGTILLLYYNDSKNTT